MYLYYTIILLSISHKNVSTMSAGIFFTFAHSILLTDIFYFKIFK